MIQDALDFENVFEEAIAALLQSAGLTVFTSGQVPNFQKDRPRVELIYKHGPAHHPLQTANQQVLPSDLKGEKIIVAWDSTLHLNIVTAADASGKQNQSDLRGIVRLVFLNLANQLNGTLLTGHKINLVREAGSSRGIHPNDTNSEILQITYDLSISLHESVWSSYTRITDFGTNRTGFTRILATGTATTELFKNITDLNQGTNISGTDVIEMVHNPGPNGENVKVTVDTLAAAIGGGGGVTIVSSSPFGVLVANPGKQVFDTTPPGALWLKTSGTDASGWLQLI